MGLVCSAAFAGDRPKVRRGGDTFGAGSVGAVAVSRSIWRDLTRSHQAVALTRTVREQVIEAGEKAGDETISTLADGLALALTGVSDQLHQSKAQSSQDVLNFPSRLDNQLVFLLAVVESGPGRPTEGSGERYAELQTELDGILAELDEILGQQLPNFESALVDQGAPHIVVNRP